jgi:hypothetical protein
MIFVNMAGLHATLEALTFILDLKHPRKMNVNTPPPGKREK